MLGVCGFPYLASEATKTLVSSLVLSTLDYCNASLVLSRLDYCNASLVLSRLDYCNASLVLSRLDYCNASLVLSRLDYCNASLVLSRLDYCNASLVLSRLDYCNASLVLSTLDYCNASLVLSRLDYCNASLVASPQDLLDKIQRVISCSARLIFKIPKSVHITLFLYDLHWLPISSRIQYKIALICFHTVFGTAPPYLSEILHLYSPRSLCSAASSVFLGWAE